MSALPTVSAQRIAGGYAAPADFAALRSDLKSADQALLTCWQTSTLREEALMQELHRTRAALHAARAGERQMAVQLHEAEALMLQQRELAKQAYEDARRDAQEELRHELLEAQSAVERATANIRVLRARLLNRDEQCAAMQRDVDAARGARQHWIR